MDVLDGQGAYQRWFSFLETTPVNDMFELLDIEDKNFILNSGSYFIIIFIFLGYFIGKYIINLVSAHYSKSEKFRTVGIYFYEQSYFKSFRRASFKLFIESFFDLAMCASISILAFKEVDISLHFETGDNRLNSIITIMYSFAIIFFPVWSAYVINKHHKVLHYKEIKAKYGLMYAESKIETKA